MKFFLQFKNTPLYCAVENNYIDIVQLLLEFPNIDINRKVIISMFLFD